MSIFPSWFVPYAGPPASVPSADGTIFYAQLGSRGGDKSTFRVYVFARRGAVCEEVAIDPATAPTNHATFREELNGSLTLVGTRGGVAVEQRVPGYVAPARDTVGTAVPPERAVKLWRPDYRDNDELHAPPALLVGRVNKMKRATIQHQDVLIHAGLLLPPE